MYKMKYCKIKGRGAVIIIASQLHSIELEFRQSADLNLVFGSLNSFKTEIPII